MTQADAYELLVPAYIDYCVNVSPRTMAASIEEMSYLYAVCEQFRPRTVIDFGSGFSSYALRLYAGRTGGVSVLSVDDDAEWLERTAEFLAKRGQPTDGLMAWDEYQADPVPFDVGLYDLASGREREAGMPLVASMLRPGGRLIFDDAQHGEHQEAMRAAAATEGLVLVEGVRRHTIDSVARYAMAFDREIGRRRKWAA